MDDMFHLFQHHCAVIRFLSLPMPWHWCFNFQFHSLLKSLSGLARCGYSFCDNRRDFYFMIGCCDCMKILYAYYIIYVVGQFSCLQFKGWTALHQRVQPKDIAKLKKSFFPFLISVFGLTLLYTFFVYCIKFLDLNKDCNLWSQTAFLY